MTAISLPRRQRGRQSGSAESKYLAQRSAFCDLLLQIRSTLDFEISSRGWGYILENRGVITKKAHRRRVTARSMRSGAVLESRDAAIGSTPGVES
jgi:hypothetical protein